MKKLVKIMLISLLIIACNETSTENNNLENLKNLENTSWVLKSFNINGANVTPPINQTYEISFLEDNRIEGINDCNEILGIYKIEKNNIKFVNLGTSFANCGNKSMYKTFYSGLWTSKTYVVKKNKLVLNFDKNSKLLFIKNNF